MEHQPNPIAQKITLHIVEPCERHRVELARACYGSGHHCELYSDLGELTSHSPRSGIIFVRDCAAMDFPNLLDRLLALGIWLPVIAIDTNPEPGRIVAAIKAGALDYLSLPLDPDRLSRCLTRVVKEAELVADGRKRTLRARDLVATLSGREREVLYHLSAGGTNKVIARDLEISPRTVEIHRANMMTKLKVSHSVEAVRLCIEAKLAPVMNIH